MNVSEFIEIVEPIDFSDKTGECKFEKGEKYSGTELDEVSAALGVVLPDDYKEMIKTHGACTYFGAQFLPPDNLYKLDSECLEMEGFIHIAVNRLGNHIAFNKEMKIVLCSHDPFGFGFLADSFTEWIKIHYDFIEKLAENDEDWDHPYIIADTEINRSYQRMKKKLKANRPKKKWQFWR